VKGIAHGIMDPSDVERDRIVEVPHVRGGHRDVLGEAAVTVDSDDPRVRTNVSVSRSAEQTASVNDVSLGRHPVTLFHIGDEPPDLYHVAGEFVPDDERRLAPRLRPRIPVVDVNVGAAHSGPAHTNENLVLTDFRLRHILEFEAGCGGFLYQRFHERRLRWENEKLFQIRRSNLPTA
jgi:hypothetical protein